MDSASAAGPSTGKGSSGMSSRRPSTGEREDMELGPAAAKKAVIKRRTKTGCLTCRRRRIKCDEGKPHCNNCIKSKRVCDGYNQRVIFKDPMNSYHPSHGVFQSAAAHRTPPGAAMPTQAHHPKPPFLAPKPPYMQSPSPPEAQSQFHPNGPFPQYPVQNRQPPYLQQFDPSSSSQASSSSHPPPPLPLPPVQSGVFIPEACPDGLPSALVWQQQLPPDNHHTAFPEADLFTNVYSEPAPALVDTSASASLNYQSTATATDVWPEQHSQHVFDETEQVPEVYRQVPLDSASNWQSLTDTAMVPEDGEYWYSDDDASLGESEYDDASGGEAYHLENNDLGAIVSKRLSDRHIDQFGTRMRTFASYIDVNVLSTYAPSSSSSPLNDDKTAAVFWYFVNVTAPSMSLYDRHPIDSSTLFHGQPVSRARKHIWTYTFPIIALNHPALLQAMLALGGLQMAKLQNVPATASLKHYHLAIRRLARNYQSSFRRVQPATLAATMLLSFYEVWNSDHDKWCKHMWGANAILKEIPLKAMTRKIYRLKRQRRQELESGLLEHGTSPLHNVILADKDIDQVDCVLLGQLAGHHIDIEDEVIDEAPSDRHSNRPASAWTTPDHYTEKDMETYELMGDVFWWYCKMDIYQSILGGTPLLMDFERWTHYLPRGPINHIDAIYGTYDHLVVLIARLCAFSSRDQARKRKVKRPGPPANAQGQSPPFTGMMPSTGRVTVPKGFSPPRETSPSAESQEEIDLETSTAMALHEWETIRDAFALFRAQLGPEFEPLGPEYELPVSSPFGLALNYRTYGIAGIWMNYNMGLIILQRCHPSMPPVAMAAVGMAARQTAPYANDIGRIMAGITVEDLSNLNHVSTLLAGVFIECSFPIFVAGVQYQDTAQRYWTVKSMHNVARLTGWQSARQIAIGCETAWTKAAQMGRGAPYVPPTDLPAAVQEFIWHRPRRIMDRISELNEDDEKVVLSRTEQSHYAIGLLSMESDMEKLELRDGV